MPSGCFACTRRAAASRKKTASTAQLPVPTLLSSPASWLQLQTCKPFLLRSRARGSRCFDVELYRTHNADLKHIRDPVQLWEHYVTLGQFEGRPFQFNCENKIE